MVSRQIHDRQFGLSDARGFNDDHVEFESFEQGDDLARGAAQTAVAAASREAADIDPGVAVMVGHPHAIAEHGAARKGTGGVDRQYRDLLLARTQLAYQAVDQGGFAGPRRTGDADDMGRLAGVVKPLHHGGDVGAAIFHQRDQPGQREPVAGGEAA